ncbi:hypothetical protein BDN71DRAFT_1435893 [Pleurotus eryngii]|uniref:Uncharacterized protein n=1 Tax=Pleurotus eryngii TaxID=5323 RepID=A0A9P5ZLF2_PLEER|nr:hypothetical protein BDN71DRAFT_1435893 [Pleurotus eryngii]
MASRNHGPVMNDGGETSLSNKRESGHVGTMHIEERTKRHKDSSATMKSIVVYDIGQWSQIVTGTNPSTGKEQNHETNDKNFNSPGTPKRLHHTQRRNDENTTSPKGMNESNNKDNDESSSPAYLKCHHHLHFLHCPENASPIERTDVAASIEATPRKSESSNGDYGVSAMNNGAEMLIWKLEDMEIINDKDSGNWETIRRHETLSVMTKSKVMYDDGQRS